MARNNETDTSAINIIRQGTDIVGDITCKGDIRIDGKLKGTLNCDGKVVVGEGGLIEGTITCKNADISGSVKVSISVKELLTLKSTSNLVGDINTNKLQIEPGANFSGNCKMGAVVKGIESSNDRKGQEKTA
ncbi:polymer-forming cytoskeletal protein [Cryomorphaceae bacterium S-15]|uniref:Polymer-forming cytoskeletal protein n=2 Tax=Acidiluteibacter ferrifornacis TaxID=2692424 RepID=A0A6N9NEK8_9FLAO|nr:polymer-forming cytoskeletal protein [bacterium]NBG65058.1 polymer-forming cytoskeletal protein [Acidiluteibacter ferrifornacis]